ncbi:hypothetical protein Tco_0462313 [Tanacetum coccineum]
MNTPIGDGNFMGVDDQREEGGLGCDYRSNNMFGQSCLKCRQVVNGPKKEVQFALGNDTRSHGDDDQLVEKWKPLFGKWTSHRLMLIDEKQATITAIKS